MHNDNTVEFEVYGDYALFTDPISKPGGERCSYPVPTYEALKGILKSAYWKPTFIWIIDRVRIMNPIRMESRGVIYPDHNSKGVAKDMATCTFLRDVRYQVQAHFEWNVNRSELKEDRNATKHLQMARRFIERGGRRQVWLGTTECFGYVGPCTFGEGVGAYDDNASTDFGLMVHGITYPDENSELGSDMEKEAILNLWSPKMENGVIAFPKPGDRKIIHKLLPKMKIKHFGKDLNNITFAEEEE